MEIVGLAVGVPGLFTACMDILERASAYKEFGVESRSTIARFEADKLRLKRWASEVGVSDGKWKESQDHRLNDRSIESVVKSLLISACETFDAAELTRSKLRNNSGEDDGPFPTVPGLRMDSMKVKTKSLPSTSIRGGIGWAYKRRGKFTNQVDMFNKIVDALYDLLPPKTSESHLLRPSGLEDHIHDEQTQDLSESTSVQKDTQLLLDDMRRRVRLQSQNAVNDWLDITKLDDRHNFSQYYDKQVSSRLEGTCEWIFSHPTYRSWMSDDSPEDVAKLLWICASAGHGKTVLCARLVQHLKGMKSFPVAYFFASPHAQSGGEPTSIVRSWIAQLTQFDSSVLEFVQGHSEAGQRASESAIWSIFGSIVSQNRNYVFVLDGFDEYNRQDDIRTEFLQKLKKTTERTATKILIFSRDETDIRAVLSPTTLQSVGYIIFRCKISKEDVRHDISIFSKSVVDKKLPKKDGHLRQNLAGQLTEKCEGMFLWIKLQQDQLRSGKNAKQLQNIVNNMPNGLTKTYERNWKTIQSHSLEEQNRALAILRWTTFAFRPLTVSEISVALIVELNGVMLQLDELPDDIDDDYINDEIIDICGALVETREERSGDGAGSRTIHLIHPSVREFLLSTLAQNAGESPKPLLGLDQILGQAEHHRCIATICLTFLNFNDVWQRSKVQDDYEHTYSFIHYAARYWDSHVIAGGKDNPKLVSLVEPFLRLENRCFDQWRRYIESLRVTAAESQENPESQSAIATPLYYAALLDLPTNMESIWAKDRTQLNTVGGEYGTPLQAACFKGHELAFDLLICWGANPNVEGGQFGIPINAAIAMGHRRMVEVLVRMGVNLTKQDSMGRTPLYTAVKNGHTEIVSLLIEAGADIKTMNKHRWTPLNLASDSGYLDIAKLLLENGADMGANSDGWTPLHSASGGGHLDVVKLLLENGADISANSDGWTPLHLASVNGHLDTVKLLLKNSADMVARSDGWTPLHLASVSGHLDVVKLFLENGADIEAATSDGWTPIFLASMRGHLNVAQFLLENGADIKATSNGWTPLNFASYQGNLDVVKLLLENGTDIEAASHEWTPLHSASYQGHLDVVKHLLEKGADTEVANSSGWTPLNLASKRGHLDIVKLLLENGADTAVANSSGWTPLHSASKSGHLNIVKLLLENGADTAVANSSGWTPLHAASKRGHVNIVKVLLEKGTDVAVANKNGWTPLNSASNRGDLEVVKLLLENGADQTIASKDGWTPLCSAADSGHMGVVKLLLESGADVNCLGGVYGSFLHFLAFKGYTDQLHLVCERFHAEINLADSHDRTLLQLAASGGHIETFQYLSSLGLNPGTKDAKGEGLLHYASLGGSLEILNVVLDKSPIVPTLNGHWSPLHWACRAGNPEIVERLIKEGFRSECVTLPNSEGQWSPASIAIFHGNEKMLTVLPATCKDILGIQANANIKEAVEVHGRRHDGFECDSCFHDIYGPRFHCHHCQNVDYCFMCKPLVEHLHENHSWKRIPCKGSSAHEPH